MGIPATTTVNGFLGSLPRIRRVRAYKVWVDGQERGVSRANNKEQAIGYVRVKYPDANIRVKFIGWHMVN